MTTKENEIAVVVKKDFSGKIIEGANELSEAFKKGYKLMQIMDSKKAPDHNHELKVVENTFIFSK